MRFVSLFVLSLTVLPLQSFAFDDARPTTHVGYEAGKISRFQREVIALNDANNPNSSPASQYFDDVMDHLEVLMADKIRENNEIAAQQEAIPGYSF